MGPWSPLHRYLNGEVKRLDLTDQQEFYQFLEYSDEIDIHEKLKECGNFYNYHRPNDALTGNTLYYILREKILLHNSFPDPSTLKKEGSGKEFYLDNPMHKAPYQRFYVPL